MGRRAVIIGNGPSLRETDLSLLRNEFTFGLNRAYLLFEELGFATTFLVCVNALVIDQTHAELAVVPSRKFIRWDRRDLFTKLDNTAFVQTRSNPAFYRNPYAGMWEGGTVTFVAMQLAFHMGFREIILVGVDHSFSTQGTPHQVVTSEGEDLNHFTGKYFGAGFRWQLPDLEMSERSYALADTAYRLDGRSIIDSTEGGKLRVFRRMPLAEALDR